MGKDLCPHRMGITKIHLMALLERLREMLEGKVLCELSCVALMLLLSARMDS